MRKMLLQLGAVALVLVPPVTLPTIAQAQNASGQVDICETLVETGSYESVGECISEMRTSPLGFCKFLKDIDVYPVFLFDPTINDFVEVANQGQCVSLIRQF